MDETTIKQKVLSFPGIELDDRSTDQLSVYSLGNEVMLAIKNNSLPLNITLRCDYNLGKTLRDEYESVLLAQGFSKSRFVTILLTGQLEDSYVDDLIRHAYEQTKNLVQDYRR